MCMLCRSLFVLLHFFFWPLCCLFFLIYGFSLPFWYLLAIVLSVLLDIRILITPLVSFGHCVVCSSWYTDSHYPFGIFWPLSCLFFLIYGFSLPLWYLLVIVLSVLLDIRILITPLVSFGHCVVCSSLYTDADYPFGVFKLFLVPGENHRHCIVLYILYFFYFISNGSQIFQPLDRLDRPFLLSHAFPEKGPRRVWRHQRGNQHPYIKVCSSWYTDSNYPVGIFWPLCCLFFLIYGFSLPLWYLLAIFLSVLLDIRILITPLISFGHFLVCSSWLNRQHNGQKIPKG
jgi:hypothetical protein